MKIIPPIIPYAIELVYISGFIEIMLGVLILFKMTRRKAAWGLVALLVAVFPANIYMSLAHERFGDIPLILLYLRLPLQALLIYWAYSFTKIKL